MHMILSTINKGFNMAQYVVRKGKMFYELAKFEDSDSPTAVYFFTKRGCNCPAGRSNCKHFRILKEWQKTGSVVGSVYTDEAKLLTVLNIF